MKENFKTGAKLFLKLIVVNIMCFFVVMSFSVLSTAAFTKNVGYKAYGTSSDSSEPQELYTHYYADGEDTKKAASSFSFHYDDSCRPKTVRNRIKRKRQIHLLTAAVLTVIIGAVVLAIIL